MPPISRGGSMRIRWISDAHTRSMKMPRLFKAGRYHLRTCGTGWCG